MTTPEEEFNKNVWQVLGNIESERLQTLKGKPVEYKFPVHQVVGPGIISQEDEKKILYKLQEWGVLKIRENPWEPPESTPNLFYLDLNIKEYKKIYLKFQKICDLDAYLNEYQNKLLKGKKPPEFLHIPDTDTSKLALRSTFVKPYENSAIREATAKDIADEFSEGNYNFVLMVLREILNLSEFSINNKISYSLQSPPGQDLIKERSLLKKFESFGMYRNLGEDGVFGIASLVDVNTGLVEDVIKQIEQKGQDENTKNISNEDKIHKWIESKDEWTIHKIWQVVSALNSEWQLRDEDTFRIPLDKFERAKLTNINDLEAILTNLHKQTIIEVLRKVSKTPPLNNPEKPQGSLWASIVEQPGIVRNSDTQIKIFPDKFKVLRDILFKLLGKQSVEEDKKNKSKQVLNAAWSDDFRWEKDRYVFGKFGMTTSFNSRDRKNLFKALTDAKGNWVTVKKLCEVTAQNENYVRPTIGQVERGFSDELLKHITIPSTIEDNLEPKPQEGAYRIKFTQ